MMKLDNILPSACSPIKVEVQGKIVRSYSRSEDGKQTCVEQARGAMMCVRCGAG
jgi:hypothetical protein